jgi:hypothetical protein
MTEFLPKVISALGWVPGELVKKKHGSSREITNIEFIEAVLTTSSILELATKLGIGEQTVNRIIAKYLVPLFGKRTGGGDTWKLALLNNASLKRCNKCSKILGHENFSKDSHNFDKLNTCCKDCKSTINANFYTRNKYVYHKNYIDEHRSEYNARNAFRRAVKLKATPSWANLEKIKEIYAKCPQGYHVDHIFPLISSWVCGLHVPENLQYLSAAENLRKGNRNIASVGE